MAHDDRNPLPAPGRGARVSRRTVLKGGLALGAAGAVASGLSSAAGATIERAMAVDPPAGASLNDIEHVVILMQENRSFDHYFGTLSGVRGFSDPDTLTRTVHGQTYTVFDQFGYRPGVGVDPAGFLQPFELEQVFPTENGDCTNDITHEWGPQHQSWHDGAMDDFVVAHLAADGVTNFAPTMGYFTRADLPFYYALADAFTICDQYFCSVLGPTDPNRCMALSASIDPGGTQGGPVLVTQVEGRVAQYGTFTWETMPQRLLDAGVSWKVYNDPTGLALFSPLPYFKAYVDVTTRLGATLTELALTPTYPANLIADVATGNLPQVSWIMGPVTQCEHPATAPQWGENLVQTVLDILTSNPEVWAKTLFILDYDENGGFFDHVPPPTAPPGTAGEYVTVRPLPADAAGIAGPIGLGFRTPCLMMSPLTRGGYVCSEVFDHTSTLRLLETLFGVEVPNLSAWRRSVTGDMTGALALGNPPDLSIPTLPLATLTNPVVDEEVVLNALAGTNDQGVPYPPPTENVMPVQETTPPRPAPPR
ncbi:MAG: alkaline phosphatase family protein [Acidimicrobiales bacterium]